MDLHDLKSVVEGYRRTGRMPALFVGHGNPMNALYDNAFTRSLASVGKAIGELEPRAVLVISAHWLSRGTQVSVTPHPGTIHDFGGFPDELYGIQYPAPGAPAEAREARRLLAHYAAEEDARRGLDHGAWTILRHMFPAAALPTFQVSIDYLRPPEHHYALARELQLLREKGVLIIGSGNIVHNLQLVDFADEAKPYDWAIEFDELLKSRLQARDYSGLVDYPSLGSGARLAVPTNDHYLPMLYTLGVSASGEELTFFHEEIQNASISMRCFQLG